MFLLFGEVLLLNGRQRDYSLVHEKSLQFIEQEISSLGSEHFIFALSMSYSSQQYVILSVLSQANPQAVFIELEVVVSKKGFVEDFKVLKPSVRK